MKNRTLLLIILATTLTFPGTILAQQAQDSTVVNERKPMDLDSLINAPVYNTEPETEPEVVEERQEVEVAEPREMEVTEEPNVVVTETFNDEYGTVRVYSLSTSKPKKYKDKNKNNRDDIKTIAGGSHHSGGFGALSFRSTSFRDETMVLAGLRGGWIINRSLAIGF
ncbi:MAG: hypothetical protein AAGC88_16910, partial [Bacteroidota bacterium]